MSALEENEALVRRFFDALSRGDVAEVDALYAEDFTLWTAGTLPISGRRSRKEAMEGMALIFEAFPSGIRFTIDALTVAADRVAVEAHSDGLHASGRHYHNLYHFLVRIRDGKIVELKEYMDTALAGSVLFPDAE